MPLRLMPPSPLANQVGADIAARQSIALRMDRYGLGFLPGLRALRGRYAARGPASKPKSLTVQKPLASEPVKTVPSANEDGGVWVIGRDWHGHKSGV